MADETNLVNELSPEQQRDAEIDVDITKRKFTVHRQNLMAMDVKVKEFQKKGLPYCYRCGKLDMEKYQRERVDAPGVLKKYKSEKNIPYTIDHKKYGDAKHFKLLRETEKVEQRRIQGERLDYVTVFKDYECRVRPNSHISVEMSTRMDKER